MKECVPVKVIPALWLIDVHALRRVIIYGLQTLDLKAEGIP